MGLKLDIYTDISINFTLKLQFAGFSIIHNDKEIVQAGFALTQPMDRKYWTVSERGEMRAIGIAIQSAVKAIPSDQAPCLNVFCDNIVAVESIHQYCTKKEKRWSGFRMEAGLIYDLRRKIEERKGYVQIFHIDRKDNRRADELAMLASREYEIREMYRYKSYLDERKSIEKAWAKTIS